MSRGMQSDQGIACAEAAPAVAGCRRTTSSGIRAKKPADRGNDTSRRAIAAARTILEREGYEALTLEAINREAGIANKTVVRYYFGDKDRLVEVAMSGCLNEYFSAQFPPLPAETPLEQRIDAYVDALREMHRTQRAYLGFLTVLPHVLRDETQRKALEVAHGERKAGFIASFFSHESDDADLRRVHEAVACLATAAYDGLAVQTMIHGAVRNLDGVLANLRACLLLAAEVAAEPVVPT